MTHKILTSPFFVNFVLSHNVKKVDFAKAMHQRHLSTDLEDDYSNNDPRYNACGCKNTKSKAENAIISVDETSKPQ